MNVLDGAILTAIPATAAIGAAMYGTFMPESNFWGKVSCRGSQTIGSQISLTFDDGPEPGASETVLDLLKELNVPAAFFVIGQNAQRWPHIVRRMDAEGHLVANHSFDHLHLGIFRGSRYWRDQLDHTDDVIFQTIGKRPAIFRPPMGHTTWLIHKAARQCGHRIITWSRGANDGLRAKTTEVIIHRLTARTSGGDILMLHDGIDPQVRKPIDRTRAAAIAALRPLITDLRNRGFRFVRLETLLRIPPYQ